MTKTFVAIPTQGAIHTLLVTWVMDNTLNVDFFSSTNNVTPVSKARNSIVDDFLKTDCERLLMIDSDTVPPKDAIEKLQQSLQDETVGAVTGITPILNGFSLSMNVYKEHSDVEKKPLFYNDTEPFPVVGAGASCLMVKREVFLNIEKPYFKTIEFDNGAFCSEDLYFSQKVIDNGFKIMARPDVLCQHHKMYPLTFSES